MLTRFFWLCDGVGGNTKTQFEAVALDLHGNKEVLAIHNAEDVAKLLKEKTNLSYDITVHKQEQTDEIKQSIGKLSSLVGALQIHEVMIDSNLVIKKKNLPTDPFYKAVLINQTRRTVANDLEFDDIWLLINDEHDIMISSACPYIIPSSC